MTIITLHEAEQRAEVKQPLKWPTHPTCNQNCNQGRACDCTVNVEDDDEYARPPMTRGDALLAVGLCAACWGVVAAVYVAVWGL